ncbi:MAG: hypothetical protein ACFFDS_03695 [Candidatus Thorarchaeota archaeon]
MFVKQKFLLAITIWTYIIGSILAIVFYFIMRDDLSGIEWFGSPSLGMVYLIILMTAFFFIARKKEIKPSIIIIFWFFILFLATVISMIALAYAIFSTWVDFQAMPVMGTFHLILWAGAVHFSFMKKERQPLYLLLVWTVTLFITTLTTMLALGFGLFMNTGWEDWQIYPIIGTSIWSGLLIIAYFALRKPKISWVDSLFYWGWSMFIGITVSMLCVYFILLDVKQLWPFIVIAGTVGLAMLFSVLKFFGVSSNKMVEAK